MITHRPTFRRLQIDRRTTRRQDIRNRRLIAGDNSSTHIDVKTTNRPDN